MKNTILGLISGLSLWIRPEGFIVAFVVVLYKLYLLNRDKHLRVGALLNSLGMVVYLVMPLIIMGLAYFYFHYSQTGKLLPQSGMSRILMGGQGSVDLGWFNLNLKFTKHLIYYFPMTVFMVIGIKKAAANTLPGRDLSYWRFMMILLAVFFVLYSTILSAHHFARYTIFLIPVMVLLAVRGLRETVETRSLFVTRKNTRILFAGAGVCMALLFTGEIYLRVKSGSNYPSGNLWTVMEAPSKRKQLSDELYKILQGNDQSPIQLAYQEVQIRYKLDDRFVIRSLDGRVDEHLLKYVNEDGYFDHIGYIRDRGINYIMETPNYNRNKKSWSLASLKQLSDGDTVEQEGMRFTKVNEFYKVDLN